MDSQRKSWPKRTEWSEGNTRTHERTRARTRYHNVTFLNLDIDCLKLSVIITWAFCPCQWWISTTKSGWVWVGGWGELYPLLLWIVGMLLTLQSPLARKLTVALKTIVSLHTCDCALPQRRKSQSLQKCGGWCTRPLRRPTRRMQRLTWLRYK